MLRVAQIDWSRRRGATDKQAAAPQPTRPLCTATRPTRPIYLREISASIDLPHFHQWKLASEPQLKSASIPCAAGVCSTLAEDRCRRSGDRRCGGRQRADHGSAEQSDQLCSPVARYFARMAPSSRPSKTLLIHRVLAVRFKRSLDLTWNRTEPFGKKYSRISNCAAFVRVSTYGRVSFQDNNARARRPGRRVAAVVLA